MIVWIFVAHLATMNIDMFNSNYAMTTKEACEEAIKGSTMLRCIPLKLVGP